MWGEEDVEMQDINVTIQPGADLKAVASRLAAHGLVIEDTLDAINCITGKASPDVIQKLRAEPEVTDVSDIVPVQLPPKASPITW
jgi:hypothetical protein